MKFAKKLQEELEQGWNGQYLDYKALKKVMKNGEGEDFCNALSSELHKVHDFMRHQQEALQDQIPGMLMEETQQIKLRGRSEERLENCVVVVQKIESFKHYSDLTFEAMRKIIKKFDKRFHCRFQEKIGMPAPAQQLVTSKDISVRLLQPANECLRQMQLFSTLLGHPSLATRLHVERPLLQLRQFTFWLRELENGLQLLGIHITGEGDDWSTFVKNTFIEVNEHGESPLRRSRAKSWCAQMALPSESNGSHNSDYEAASSDEPPEPAKPSATTGATAGASSSSRPAYRKNQGVKEEAGKHRWWADLSDLCPLSGFPIAHLPYPPFKLQVAKGQGHNFFDGQFLMLHILSSFNFEISGRSLMQQEIQALDGHVKKCKLSPFRLSRALELLYLVGQGNAHAQQEMAELRSKAAKKLGALKHIQRARLQRGDCATPAVPGPQPRR